MALLSTHAHSHIHTITTHIFILECPLQMSPDHENCTNSVHGIYY